MQGIPTEPSHFLRLQLDLFATLAVSAPASVLSLILNNVLDVPDAIYEQAFRGVLRRLQTLEISVLCCTDYGGSYAEASLGPFWDTSMAHMIRSADKLTSLTLRSDQPVGACLAISFKDFQLPNLAALTIESFVLEPRRPISDVAAFIVAHKATLTHLELRGCSIDGREGSQFPHPWRAVFKLFEAELVALHTFVLRAAGKERMPCLHTRRWSRVGIHAH
ncbi:hypothetical protein FB451DRAFT_1406786 [Mycena latifolia]|nr:hypothetical protein FB451DRAFT_1406786 [Mycena latifolia]